MMMPMATEEEIAVGQRIARNLQALLRAKGLNQGQLAYKAGLSASNISNLVQGRKNPSFLSVAKAAKALEVDPMELAGFRPLQMPEVLPEDPPSGRLEELEKQVRALSALPEQVAKLADAMADFAESRATKPRPGGKSRRTA